MGVSIRIDTRARPKERNEKSQFYEAFFYILSLGRALHLIEIKWTLDFNRVGIGKIIH